MSTLKTDTLSNTAGSKTVPMATVVDGSAKAWVNFNGTGTVAIRASFNVSSITDNGVGDYTVNFTTALPDANYSTASHFQWDATNTNIPANGFLQTYRANGTQGQTATNVRLNVATAVGAATDIFAVCLSIFR